MTPHNKLTADEVLRLMSDSERRQACHHFWQNAHTSATANATQMVEALQNIGKGRLRKMGPEKQTVLLARLLLTPPAKGMLALVVNFGLLQTKELPNLQTLLDLLPEVGKAFRPFSTAELVKAISSLRSNYSERQVTLLLAAVASLTPKNNSDVDPFLEIPAALDYLEMNLRNSLAASRETQNDPRITVLQAEVDSQKETLAAAARDLERTRRLLSNAQETHLSEIADAKKKHEDLIAGRKAAITEGVKLELSKELRPWIADARALQSASACRTDVTLAKRISAELSRLEALDMAYGSWKRCTRRLARFEGFAGAIKKAVELCLQPTPELLALRGEIETEISRLRKLLHAPSSSSALFAGIHDLLAGAPSRTKLDEVQSLISPLCSNRLLTEKECRSLFKAAKRHHDRFKSLIPPNDGEAPYRTGWDLDRKLRLNESATVYIDGNNVLLQLTELYANSLESGRIGQTARDALIVHVGTLAERCPKVNFHIVFDDNTKIVSKLVPNLVVELSGGTGSDRADNVIISHVAALGTDNEGYVVTDDKGFRESSVYVGGIYVPSRLWYYFLCEHRVITGFEPHDTADASPQQ